MYNASTSEDTLYAPVRQLNYRDACLLVVEDQDDLWTLLQFALKKQLPDVEIHRTSNRLQAINFIDDRIANRLALPKLILQDLYMPDRKSGLDLLRDTRMILNQHQYVPIPIIVISSSTDPEDIQQAYKHSATYYVVKPVDLHQWIALCRDLRSFWWEQGVLPVY